MQDQRIVALRRALRSPLAFAVIVSFCHACSMQILLYANIVDAMAFYKGS